MSKLKKERLDQMIENALSYKQESRRFDEYMKKEKDNLRFVRTRIEKLSIK